MRKIQMQYFYLLLLVSIFNSCTLNRQCQNRSDDYSGSFSPNSKVNEQQPDIQVEAFAEKKTDITLFQEEPGLKSENVFKNIKINPLVNRTFQVASKYVPHKIENILSNPKDSILLLKNDQYYLEEARKSSNYAIFLTLTVFLIPIGFIFGIQAAYYMTKLKKSRPSFWTVIKTALALIPGLFVLVLFALLLALGTE